MALSQTFSAMLKEYRPVNIIKDEVAKRDYLYRNVKKDTSWKGGAYKIPLNSAIASSVKFGSLTASADIAEAQAVMGSESTQLQIMHSLIFNQADLDSADNYEGSFIKVLMDTIEPAAMFFKEIISHAMLIGSRVDILTANGSAGGVAAVNSPERFEIGQRVILRNSDPASKAVYVIYIDLNAKTITVSDSRGGSAYNISAYTTAKASAIYFDGTVNESSHAFQNTMNSLRSVLLSAANGGDATIHGLTKASYKQLQAHNKSFSGVSAENLLEELFKAYVECAQLGRGNPTELILSYKSYQALVNSLETNRRFTVSDSSAGYGFASMKLIGGEGSLKLTALREMDNDLAYIVDWNAFKLAGMRFFEPVKNMETGDPYFEIRNTTGYQYVMDVKFYGNLVYYHPSYCGVCHSIAI